MEDVAKIMNHLSREESVLSLGDLIKDIETVGELSLELFIFLHLLILDFIS